MIFFKTVNARYELANFLSSMSDIYIQKYWRPRLTLEKYLLSITFLGAIIAAGYWGVWSPLSQRIDMQRLILEQNQTILQKIKASEYAVKEWQKRILSSEDKAVTNLSQLISESAVKHKIALNRIQIQNRDVQVSPESLVFNDLIDWLLHLRKEFGVRVTYMDVTSADEAGKVRVVRLNLTY